MKTLFQLFRIALMAVLILLIAPLALLSGWMPFATATRVSDPETSRRVRTARRHGVQVGVSLRNRRAWYATPMVKENYTQITAIGVALRSVFYDQLTAINTEDNLLDRFFNVQTSTKAIERTQGVGGFGDVPEYKGAIEYEGLDLLYPQNYQHKEYAKGIAIERALIDDEDYGVMNRRASLLGLSFDRTIYNHAMGIFNNAFSTSYLGGDGKPLIATDHPLSPSNAGTQGNKGTADLSQEAVIAAEVAMMSWKDSNGSPVMVMPDTIVVPVALRSQALIIANSQGRPGTANNDANTTQGYSVVVDRYLTDSDAWFLVDSRMAKMYLNWFWRVRPEFKEDPTSDYNLMMRYRGYMRYVFGWDHWQFIWGSDGSGS